MDQAQWLKRLQGIGRDHGFFERLGADHLALFVQESDTLVVTFDSAARVYAQEADGLPLGFEAVQRKEWSLLSILSLDEGWFRSQEVTAFFESLSQSGFFESFAQVIFIGFGPGAGHAACAYSAAAPGAFVLASAPAATLEPLRAGFDRRYMHERRLDFTRFGDAPGLVAAAREALILFDPTHAPSCAHAAQFRGKAITLAPLRFGGPNPHDLIRSGGLLLPILRALVHSRLTAARMAALLRPIRRADPAYLWRLAGIAQRQGQFDRARKIAEYAADVTGEQRFADLAARLTVQGS